MKHLDLTNLKSYEQCSIANLLTKFVANYCWTKKLDTIETLILYKYDDQFYIQDKDCDDELPEDNYLITEIDYNKLVTTFSNKLLNEKEIVQNDIKYLDVVYWAFEVLTINFSIVINCETDTYKDI